MASLGLWAVLPPDLLRFISDGFVLPLESYSSIRGVCTAWRSALPTAAPLLLTVSGLDAPRHRQVVSASFLTAGRSFHLSELPKGGQLVGSSNGWIAVDTIWPGIFLLNPTSVECRWFDLFPLRDGDDVPVHKVVFAPNPTADDFTAVAICGPRELAYARARDMRWTFMDVAMAEQGDKLADLVYDTDGRKVNCVTAHGDVHVFHVPGCRRRRPRVAPLQANRAGGLFAPPYDTASKHTAKDASGVRPNCVYWIDERSRFQPMVFDMATRTSTLAEFIGGWQNQTKRALAP
ncbi:uncharacterized protein LOC120681173 [Panicum virgatum]|uniref:uncharacterized protein LOC120681173 n=1 Tax=Panicum virgatum TaxID=38727 RepID=UPI0019D65FCA|nr:uncharacterized protein LOC120681173 [Panicum virgatum]